MSDFPNAVRHRYVNTVTERINQTTFDPRKTTVFITGATGLLGSAVAAAFSRRGHPITALVRREEQREALRAKGYRTVVGDLCEPAAWQHEAAAADVLIHLAIVRSGKRLGQSWVAAAIAAERIGMRGLIAAASQGGRCRALVHTSGISIYGDHGDEWIDESSPLRPGAIGRLKLAGECLAREAAEAGLPAFSLRPGLTYAAAGVFRDFFLAQAAKQKFNYIGTGAAFHSMVHLDDLVAAYALAVERPPIGEALNLTDNEPLRWREFADVLLAEFGGGKAKGAPPWLVSLFAGRPLVEMLTSSYRVRNARAKERLGWNPKHSSLRDGIRLVAAEYRCANIAESRPSPATA
jgi:nucleoside-diphosphate-sugar epimerase